jgi:hypothetical protein
VKGRQQGKKTYCEGVLWPCGGLKFQIAFWAFRPTSTKYIYFKVTSTIENSNKFFYLLMIISKFRFLKELI